MILDYLLLPAIFFLGIITSYQDFKFGKIKNKWIISGLFWGLGVYIVLCLWLLLGGYFSLFANAGDYISFSYVFSALLNAAISLVVGYAIWYFDLWSAGDAKLFFVFSLLLPLTHYRNSYLPYFPSFALLINIFIPALTFLLLQGTILLLRDAASKPIFSSSVLLPAADNAKVYLRKNYSSLFKSFLAFALIFLSFRLFHQTAFEHAGKYRWLLSLLFLSFFGASRFLREILKKNYILYLSIFAFAVFSAISGFERLKQTLVEAKSSLVFLVAFPLVALIFSYSQKKTRQKNMAFAVWLFLGILVTLILKGPLTFLVLN